MLKKINYNFLVLIVLNLFLVFFTNSVLDGDRLYIKSLSESFSEQKINEILNFKEKWQWIGYLSIPLLLLIKITIFSTILDIGCFFFNRKVAFRVLFNIVVKAEFIFLIVIILKCFWFLIFDKDYTLQDLQYFYPLSAINITGYKDLQPWFVYPLQILNLFEIAYWFTLAYLLGNELKIRIEKGLIIVASSYGVGLITWIVTIMFFTLNAN